MECVMNSNEEIKILTEMLFNKFNKITLSAKETAEVLGISEEALKDDRQNASGIAFTRRNRKEHGKPLYSITAIAKHMVINQVRVA